MLTNSVNLSSGSHLSSNINSRTHKTKNACLRIRTCDNFWLVPKNSTSSQIFLWVSHLHKQFCLNRIARISNWGSECHCKGRFKTKTVRILNYEAVSVSTREQPSGDFLRLTWTSQLTFSWLKTFFSRFKGSRRSNKMQNSITSQHSGRPHFHWKRNMNWTEKKRHWDKNASSNKLI